MAAMTASVPLPSIRNISTEGTWRLTSLAMASSSSWKSPVAGPQRRKSSSTGSRTASGLLPRIVGPPAWRKSRYRLPSMS